MAEFNLDRIKNITGEINEGLAKLEKIKQLTPEEFVNNPEKIDSAKYNLIVVTEGASDICNHVAVKAGGRAPQSYAGCFEILEQLNLLSHEMAMKLRLMAKFRNLLVHRYWKIDNQKVYEIISNDIWIVRDYLEAVDTYVRTHQEKAR